jgi:hypothetical protein
MNEYDKEKYKIDFPDHGDFNWKWVKLKTPEHPYYDGHKTIGVVLHDGNFMTNGVLFLKNQYEIIDEESTKEKNMNKVLITEDRSSEMLKIVKEDGTFLFEGNYWDFNRDGGSFKKLFEAVGVEVELTEKDYDEWY